MSRATTRRLITVAGVLAEPRLRRLELAWGGYYLAEWTHFVALSIYAFDHGGAAAVGVFGFVRMGAAALALPFGSLLTDRYPRHRVLLASYAARTALLGLTAAALAAGSGRSVVFALAALAAVSVAPVRPATMSLVPQLARTPAELVAANVASSAMEGVGTLLGPLAGGLVTAGSGPAAAVAAAAAISLGCATAVFAISREGEVAVRVGTGRGLASLLGGARTLVRDRDPGLVVLLFSSQTLVRGILNVLLTVAAIDVLGLGQSGVGWLNGALGAGAILGGAATIGMVSRRRLALPITAALTLWGAPIALIGATGNAYAAFAAVLVIGVGNALLDVSGFTLLQRTVDEHVLGRVFGAFEILVAASVAIGSGLGAIAERELGVRTALVVTGLILPTLALASVPRLRRIDAASTIPARELAILSRLPLFAPLPVTTLERLAQRLQPLSVAAGTTIVGQGEQGDEFYVVTSGEVDVIRDGEPVRTLEAGDWFGEIALLRDVPRTATCRAATDVEALVLDRASFVFAVSGDLRTVAAADAMISSHLAADAA